MGKSLILAVKIIGDASDAIKAMDSTASASDKFAKGLNTAAKVSAVGLGAIAVGAKQAVDAASDLEQSTGAVSSVFGKYADEMTGYAKGAADAVGLSQNQYNESAVLLGAQLKNMGISMEEVGGTTNDLIGLGADLAATFGGTTADATAALSSLLRGERDPIEKYGVSIKQADINARMAAQGMDKLTGDAKKNAELQVTLALLTEQTAGAQGQFARETDSAAGSAQIAAAKFEDAKAALGEVLLPVVTEIAEKFAEFSQYLQDNTDWIIPLVGAVAGLAAAIIVINGAYKAFAAVQAIQTAAQWASNAAWLASPITWIILAIIAAIAILVTAIVLVVQNWDLIKEKAVEVWTIVIDWIKMVIDWVQVRIVAAIAIATAVWANIKAAALAVWNAIISVIKTVVDWVSNKISAAVAVATAVWAAIKTAASNAFDGVVNAVKTAINWIKDTLSNAVTAAVTPFITLKDGAVGALQSIIEWVQNAINWVKDLASNAIPGWAKDLLGMAKGASMPITPEVAGLAIPDYQARMMVTPDMGAVPQAMEAGGLASRSLLSVSPIVPGRTPSVQATAVQNVTNNTFNFPNYAGSRDELAEYLRKALDRLDRRNERLTVS